MLASHKLLFSLFIKKRFFCSLKRKHVTEGESEVVNSERTEIKTIINAC